MGYSPESPRDMSPDVVSPYTERPIRPLPKRRLRERLSPDVAETIKYPPAPKTITPLFYHPYNVREETRVIGVGGSQHPTERERADEIERNYISRRNGDEVESEEDEAAYRSRIYSRHSVDPAGRSYRYVQKLDAKLPNPQPPASAASSADGYDSFENTNNKKKRKIPTPGDSTLNGVHHSGDSGAMGSCISGIDHTAEDVHSTAGTVGSYHSPGSISSSGISGPGRGRYGRNRNGRSPLRTLSDSSGNWVNGRNSKQRQQWSTPTETPGIISRSIANANADKSPITPARGQENFSLLQQQASKKSSPSTQFTFTCDSQVPGTVPWPGPSANPLLHQSPTASRMSTHSTQTTPAMSGNHYNSTPAPQAKQTPPAGQQPQGSQKQTPAPAPPKKMRRRTGKEYLIAARERRQTQAVKNYHHPPAIEDIWICEFCEYERIFGTPPEALIKQYEIKDRRIRKQEAERKRLLDKAKMKGRKGKKGNKAAAKTNNAAQDRQSHHQPSHPPPMNQSNSQGTQSEEYYEDEYDEEYAAGHDEPPLGAHLAPPISRNDALHPDPGKHLGVQGGVGVGNAVATWQGK